MSETPSLRSGWTTGACATAATKAACRALFGAAFPDPVTITLPGGQRPQFALSVTRQGEGWARAGVIKDAGDDPDITHGATIIATVRLGRPGSGIVFKAGDGVGTVTKPGLPLAPGEPAINPVPRAMMTEVAEAEAARHGHAADLEIEISVPGGKKLAAGTWNPRLGILGGLSILGTTGIVVPYSCSAWIHSIQRGIDVARATGLTHVVGCTGSTSEKAARAVLGVPEEAILDMGDFAGGMLKYLRTHPVRRVTIAGGFAKLAKLAAGHLDLHSKRSQIDAGWLAGQLADLGGDADLVAEARAANTGLAVLDMAQGAGLAIGERVAGLALARAAKVLDGAPVALQVLVFDRRGNLVGRA
ncbi:cobalt-precorrin-5B (C(1))-methyltransferase [Magnetospirillum moscoviense]|uniref:Cobalt-precorrin-5B C(1)-methyltransferase n=1 Tax=Magnetospirillum moscoviense TaxID=1437059 RepID=A0A178M945_9PROT|nr:cobalt-precorrin-5B (C(1))-methyltransferase [Magnetospirillum moscoviense]OAN45272.1 cobalt-precorrin-5B (C(1))-methyltransferase [Magnetospirillum moscoviense]